MNFYKRYRRVISKSIIEKTVKSPGSLKYILNHNFIDFNRTIESLSKEKEFLHIANFTSGNAGDTLLTVVLRDLFDSRFSDKIAWSRAHAHDEISTKSVNRLNDFDSVVLGGGGLFIRDTSPNSNSGWQWNIPTSNYSSIDSNLVLFAIGYNKFRSQLQFDNKFNENVIKLFEKATFVGLRNHGSISSMKEIIPEEFHHKIHFQPCMTTLASRIYNFQPETNSTEKKVIGLNCAFDRAENRFGTKQESILENIAKAIKVLSEEHEIRYMSHAPSDNIFLPYLEKANVKYHLVKLYHIPAKSVLDEYRKLSLAIGMRGHAQMVPFGCNIPILSLISHDKLKWFIEDIGLAESGVEIFDPKLREIIVDKSRVMLEKDATEELQEKQSVLWDITCSNLEKIERLPVRNK